MSMFKSVLAVAAVTAFGIGSAQADIKIATNGPMTGQYAAFGEQMRRGAEMAVADINAKGGVLGQKLVLSIGDDACDPKQAVAVANKTASDKVVFVAGHFCSGSSIPASQVYQEEGIVQISPASTDPKLTEEGRANVFRVCGRDDQQGIVAGDLLADKFKGKKIAFLHDKTPYGKGLADETKMQLNKRGVTEATQIGPGRVLDGLWERFEPAARARAANHQPRLQLDALEKNLRVAPVAKRGRKLLHAKHTRLGVGVEKLDGVLRDCAIKLIAAETAECLLFDC